MRGVCQITVELEQSDMLSQGRKTRQPCLTIHKGCCKDKRVRPIIFSHCQRKWILRASKENYLNTPVKRVTCQV